MPTRRSGRRLSWLVGVLLALPWSTGAEGAALQVPTQYATVQAAVDAASSGDDIVIAAGRYRGRVAISGKHLNFHGAGRGVTFLHEDGSQPVIEIDRATVGFDNLAIYGGYWVPTVGWASVVPTLVLARSSDLTLEAVDFARCSIFCVRVFLGSLDARFVSLSSLPQLQADLGFDLVYSDAYIEELDAPIGTIDHVIDVNATAAPPPFPGFRSNLMLVNSRIELSELGWGDGVRLGGDVDASIFDNRFTRAPGGQGGVGVKGINVGYRVSARIRGNVFEGMPIGVLATGAAPNAVVIEFNLFQDVKESGVHLAYVDYPVVDLGGGAFGSGGGNVFCRTSATSAGYDVRFGSPSNVNVEAFGTTWSQPSPDDAIWDVFDDPQLGEVLHHGGPGSPYCGP